MHSKKLEMYSFVANKTLYDDDDDDKDKRQKRIFY